MRRSVMLLLAGLLCVSANLYAQVGVNTENPNKVAELDIQNRLSTTGDTIPKGIMIPRIREAQRDMIDVSNPANANSLMVYNIDEDCFNYYSKSESEWKSVCGNPGKANFTLANDCSDITVQGMYVKGNGLTSEHYLEIEVNVVKAGTYTIVGTTANGYGFTASGTFLNTGIQTVFVSGQGKPANANENPGDALTLKFQGETVDCSGVRIIVYPPTAIFSMNCGSFKQSGAFIKGQELTANDYITLRVSISDITGGGSWSIKSNTVDGIYFRGSGTFTTTGDQYVTLQGFGTPTSYEPKTLTFTSDSRDGAATCHATVTIAYSQKRIVTIGSSSSLGYNWGETSGPSYAMITTQANFGLLDNSVVKYEGSIIENLGTTDADIRAALTRTTNPPDIVIVGYPYSDISAAGTNAFLNYIQRGGVVLFFCEADDMMGNIMRALMGNASISDAPINAAGALYSLPVKPGDPIIDGPFGNVGGLYWGEDASSTTSFTNLPTSDITLYSYGYDYSNTSASYSDNVVAFRHNTLNFLFFGDGGFVSSNGGTSDTICPFLLDGSNYPIPKPNYGRGSSSYDQTVYNSIIAANAFAWAIKTAQEKGINAN